MIIPDFGVQDKMIAQVQITKLQDLYDFMYWKHGSEKYKDSGEGGAFVHQPWPLTSRQKGKR